MRKFNSKAKLIGLVITATICVVLVWAKQESAKSNKQMADFNEKIKKGELTRRASVKLHLDDFMVFKTAKNIFALKVLDLKTSGPEYYEVFYDCYSKPLSTNAVFDKSSVHTQGKVCKKYQKIDSSSYREDDSIADIERRIPCGDVLFDWSLSDEDNYARLAIEKIQSGPSSVEYSFTKMKDISMIDLRSRSLMWQQLK